MRTSSILVTKPSADYELLDSGEGEKLERFGTVRLSRPDPQALWARQLPPTEWNKADAYFTRDAAGAEWSFRNEAAKKAASSGWTIAFGGLKMVIKPTAFKHTGLFPEHEMNWAWMRGTIEQALKKGTGDIEVLNLFGYTGGASLACAQAGAKVVHIDSSKAAVTWARDNAEASGLADKPIRWIVEDARLFVEREIKRGRSYDAIIMDPPAFGHGVNNELWKIEEHLLPLIENCKKLLKPQPLFFLINGYSAGYSAVAYENILLPLIETYGGSVEIGELTIEESSATKKPGRLLPAGIFARWMRIV
ncbi:MAG TPA: class I SAM-dependent methyltransferase [Candidatus Paceibacterota bacterium]